MAAATEAGIKTPLLDVVTAYIRREKPTGGLKTVSEVLDRYVKERLMTGVSLDYMGRTVGPLVGFARHLINKLPRGTPNGSRN